MTTLLPTTLKQLGTIATTLVGDCIGFRWHRSAHTYRRIVQCYFRSRWSALRFARLARRHGCLVFDNVTWDRLDEQGQPVKDRQRPARYAGWRVTAIAIPDPRQRAGWRSAPPFRDQLGGQRIADGDRHTQGHAWWDGEIGDGDWSDRDRYDDPQAFTNEALGDDTELERDLDRISAEVTAWWQRSGRAGDPYTYCHKQPGHLGKVADPRAHEHLATLRAEVQQHLAQYERQRQQERTHTQIRRDNDEVQAALRATERRGR